MFVETGSGTFHCLARNEGGSSPLLLIHGLGTSSEIWTEMLDALDSSRRIVAPDVLSHGQSSPPASIFTIHHHARSMFLLLDELGIDRVAVAGNSMGAQIAAEMAATRPDRVDRLILVGCPAWESHRERLRYLDMRSPMIGNDGLPRVQGAPDISGRTPPSNPSTPRSDLGIWYLNSVWAVSSFDIVPRLSLIRSPTLVVYGSDDWLLPTSTTLMRGIEHAVEVIVPEGGHIVPRIKPNELAEAIKSFVDGTVQEA
ncbi:MAG: alpha/beta fold hydrolase [Gemmatimonas sp.]|nr:alpha/beta fold hydrolase [Gemmatimonas sp.]